jgi:dipeptidyl aminopeptidase/acylaminoacyl peptidase
LKSASPVYNADQIRARVLLIHGLQDNRAPLEHAEKLKAALTKAGQSPELLLEPREGHGFYDEGARERTYARLLAFLKENTKEDREVPGRPPSTR